MPPPPQIKEAVMAAWMAWDHYLKQTRQRLVDLTDPTASYLRDDLTAAEPADVDDLAVVSEALEELRRAWDAGINRPKHSNRPGVRQLLIRRRDLAEFTHGVAVREASLQVVADTLGCSCQALRDGFAAHGLSAPVKPRRRRQEGAS